jgi:hypothetical protein
MRPLPRGSSSLLYEARSTCSGSVLEREIDLSVTVDFGPAFSARIALLFRQPVEFPVHSETIAAKGRPKRSRLASPMLSASGEETALIRKLRGLERIKA